MHHLGDDMVFSIKQQARCAMIEWQYFPKSAELPAHLKDVIDVFSHASPEIASPEHGLTSDAVLAHIREKLVEQGYAVESSKKDADKIRVPVLFGKNGRLEKYFDANAYHALNHTVIEVEAGRGVDNYQFLKDLFQACMMHDVLHLVIAVRQEYRGNRNFDTVLSFFDTLYTSGRLSLPLKGVLIIGY